MLPSAPCYTCLLPYDPVCCSLLPNDPVYSSLLLYAPVCSCMLIFAPVCSSLFPYDPTCCSMFLCAPMATLNGEMQGGASLEHVVFGDVWLCAGQSNMWLPLSHTFERNRSISAIQRGELSNLRMTCGNSDAVQLSPQRATVLSEWWDAKSCASSRGLLDFCSGCFYVRRAVVVGFLVEGARSDTK